MKITKKDIQGIKVTGYKDCGDWIVQAGEMLPQSFKVKAWTLSDAMTFAAEIAAWIEQ